MYKNVKRQLVYVHQSTPPFTWEPYRWAMRLALDQIGLLFFAPWKFICYVIDGFFIMTDSQYKFSFCNKSNLIESRGKKIPTDVSVCDGGLANDLSGMASTSRTSLCASNQILSTFTQFESQSIDIDWIVELMRWIPQLSPRILYPSRPLRTMSFLFVPGLVYIRVRWLFATFIYFYWKKKNCFRENRWLPVDFHLLRWGKVHHLALDRRTNTLEDVVKHCQIMLSIISPNPTRMYLSQIDLKLDFC